MRDVKGRSRDIYDAGVRCGLAWDTSPGAINRATTPP
jgi:hypothetical protein